MKFEILKKASIYLLIMSVLCGLIYMFSVTGLAQLLFPQQANGSIVEVDGKKYGSSLLAQQFNDSSHLWGRIMSLDTTEYTDAQGNPVMYAKPMNLSPASEQYQTLVAERVKMICDANPDADMSAVPVDLVTCSASGLDPEISPAAATYQVPRIAKATGRSEEDVQAVIDHYTTGRFLGLFGEPRVNVLKVNLTLDGILKMN